MKKEQRGSEKLMASCSSMSTLSQEELEQVAGAGLLSSPLGGYYKVFPRGIPWPELVFESPVAGLANAGALDLGVVNGIGESLKQPGYLYKS